MVEALLESLPLSHRLALSYTPRAFRSDTLCLLALNERLAAIVRQDGEPMIAQIKLAWWRDRFAEYKGDWPVGEPLLERLSQWEGNTHQLVQLVNGWEVLLAEALGHEEIEQYARGHALSWAAMHDRLGSATDLDSVRLAAKQWALADLAVHLGDPRERAVVQQILAGIPAPGLPLARPARPLAVLRALALRAQQRGSTELLAGPGAMLLAMRVGITGR